MSIRHEDPPDRTLIGFDVIHPPDVGVLAIALIAAVGTDIAVRQGINSLSGVVLIAFVSAATLMSGRIVNPPARALIAAAPLFGMWLGWRTSPWLISLDVMSAAGLLVLGASMARSGSVLDLTISAAVANAIRAVAHGLLAPAFLLEALRTRSDTQNQRLFAIARGLIIAIPLVAILGVLLSSADAVFAHFFRFRADPEWIVSHSALLIIGAWGSAGLLRLASSKPLGPVTTASPALGWMESLIVLGCLNLLFTSFAVVQLVASSQGGRHVITTAGLTYAEYARTGFFQLLAVAAITVIAVSTLRAAATFPTAQHQRRFVILGELTIVLTLLIVAVAYRRLSLYERAFGLTMLRLFSQAFTVWIGTVLIGLGLSVGGVAKRRHWLPFAAGASGLVIVFALNAVNPEAIIVRHNVAHTARTQHFDPTYLGKLSSDALPALIDALPQLSPTTRRAVRHHLSCPSPAAVRNRWAGYNRSDERAREAWAQLCQEQARVNTRP